MSTCTSGLWTYLRLSASVYSIIRLENPSNNGDPCWTTICRLNTSLPEIESNARLLASAPKMLVALREIAAIEDETSSGYCEEIEKAREIAKTAISVAAP
jgi:hypothetical protein